MERVRRIQFNFKCKQSVVSFLKAAAVRLDVPIFALSEYILAHGVAEMAMKLGNEEWEESLKEELYKKHIWVKEK